MYFVCLFVCLFVGHFGVSVEDVIILLCAMVVIGAAVLCLDVCCCQYHMSIHSVHVVSQECVCYCGVQVPQ